MTIYVDFSDGPVTHEEITSKLTNQAHGAQNMFFGAVRTVNLGRNVTKIDYDLFAPLAKKVIIDICEEAIQQVGDNADVAVIHAFNTVKIGELSIGIGVSTPHRAESYDACRYIIEEIKTRAPIWKKEYYEDGETEWVQGHALCQHNKSHCHHNHKKTA